VREFINLLLNEEKVVRKLVGENKKVAIVQRLGAEDTFPVDGEASVDHLKETLGMFSGDNQVIVYLIELQKLCVKSQVI
jgi:hypothetical protein